MRHPDSIVVAVALCWGGLVLIMAALALGDCMAHASPPPPVIVAVASAVEGRRAQDGPAYLMDGGMCAEPELAPVPPEVTPEEYDLLERAINRCRRDVWRVADPTAMLALLRHELVLGVPDEARGITLATWCIEGAMRLQGADGGPLRGDYRDGVAMAHGPMQLWPWQREWCGLSDGQADDLLMAASCYWRRVVDRREVRARGCPDSWRVGEALASHGPRYLPHGCAAESAHWRELRRWRR